jgi:hypothetical protein
MGVWNFLFTNGVPAGADPGHHAFYILRIIDTRDPLVIYTQFPDLNNPGGYYPSLLHLMIAGLTFVSTAGENVSFSSVVASMQAFMFTVYVIGVLAYAFLILSIIKRIICNWCSRVKYILAYYGLTFLAFGLFLYSTSPVIQTFRDGGYGEILAMWAILPFYIYFLVIKKRWIISAIILAIIASTHNLSLFWSMSLTIAFFATLLVSRDFNTLKKAKYFLPVFMICALPAIIFFYYPVLIEAFDTYTAGSSGTSVNFSRQDAIDLIKPNLYYAGLISVPVLLAINGKLLGWLAGWVFAFMPIVSSSNLYTERFAREWSLVLGLAVGVCSALVIYKLIFIKYADYRVKKAQRSPINHIISYLIDKKQFFAAILISAIILPLSYGYFDSQFRDFTDKTLLNYYSPEIHAGNQYFLSLMAHNKDVVKQYDDNNKTRILVFGDDLNPWLEAYLYGKFSVSVVLPKEDALELSKSDKNINDRLSSILENPNSKEALSAIKEFNVGYIYLADLLQNRWYSDGEMNLNTTLASFDARNKDSYFNLEQQFTGEDGKGIRVYSIDQKKVNTYLAEY